MNIFLLTLNGNNTITQLPDPTTSNLVYATWALALATIVIGYFTIKSSQIQYETVNRPWLVLEKGGRIGDYAGLSLENIGNLPAEKIIITCKPIFHQNNEKKIPPDYEKDINSIGIIVPKQKYQFTFNFLGVDNIMSYDEITADIFVKYYFGKKEKTSRFHYYTSNLIDYEEITCEEAT